MTILFLKQPNEAKDIVNQLIANDTIAEREKSQKESWERMEREYAKRKNDPPPKLEDWASFGPSPFD